VIELAREEREVRKAGESSGRRQEADCGAGGMAVSEARRHRAPEYGWRRAASGWRRGVGCVDERVRQEGARRVLVRVGWFQRVAQQSPSPGGGGEGGGGGGGWGWGGWDDCHNPHGA